MQIMEQHWNEEKLNFNETVFARSPVEEDIQASNASPSFLESLDTFKVPIIGSGGAAVIMVIVVVIIIVAIRCKKEGVQASAPVIVQTTTTTSPMVSATATASPVVTTTATPNICPPPYETLDPMEIKDIDVLDRTPRQIDAMRRYSMRKPPLPVSA
jgi:hypothetical protein